MFIRNYPEDATLRRHVDAAAAFRLQALMAQGPTDSTLRRHFEQMQAAQEAETVAPAVSKQATAEPTPPAPTLPTPEKRGLLAWLSRLFGN